MPINPFNPSIGGAGGLTVDTDGTNYLWKVNGVTILRTRISDNQLLLDAGVDTDAF